MGKSKIKFYNTQTFKVFYNILSKNVVQKKIERFKQKFDVPQVGIFFPHDKDDFEKKQMKEYHSDKFKLIYSIIDKYKLPDNYNLVEEMIFYDDYYDYYVNSTSLQNDLCKISAEMSEEIRRYEIIREGTNYIKLAVSPYASKQSIKDFLDDNKNWNDFEIIAKSMVENRFKRSRVNLNKERDNFIYHLSFVDRKEIDLYYKDVHSNLTGSKRESDYKSLAIARMVNSTFDTKITAGTVESVIKRQKKLRQNKDT